MTPGRCSACGGPAMRGRRGWWHQGVACPAYSALLLWHQRGARFIPGRPA